MQKRPICARSRYNPGQSRLPRLRPASLFAGRIFGDVERMTYTNVKQIGCLILAAALLVCAGGCGKQHLIRSQSASFVVDGMECHVSWYAHVVQQEEQDFLSFVILSCGPVPISREHGAGTVVATLFPDDEKIVVKTETVYFIHDNKIVFEKEFRELGIDVSQLNFRSSRALQDYLHPILEQLIRENVPPQEPEMAEERP